MYKIIKKINDLEVYRMKVESLVSRSEQYWYGNVYVKGLPSMKEMNDKVNLDEHYSFETSDSMGYIIYIEIRKDCEYEKKRIN